MDTKSLFELCRNHVNFFCTLSANASSLIILEKYFNYTRLGIQFLIHNESEYYLLKNICDDRKTGSKREAYPRRGYSMIWRRVGAPADFHQFEKFMNLFIGLRVPIF